MEKISKAQNKRLHQLLSEVGYARYKAQIVGSYTSGRTEHSSDMYNNEAASMIAYLEAEREKCRAQKAEKCNTMRRKLIAMCYQLGWVNEQGKFDMIHLNNWCKQYGGFKKNLNEHDEKELPKLITQLQQVVKDQKI